MMRAMGWGHVHGCALFLAWMLWVPASVSAQELADDGTPPEDAVASEASSESAASVDAATSLHAPSASATSPPPRRDLRLWAQAPANEGLALLVRPGRSREAWRLVCELPCEVTPMPGSWDIAVRPRGTEHPLRVAERTLELHADGLLELRYSSREWVRVVGGAVLGVGLAGILALAIGLAVDGGFGEAGSLSNAVLGTAYGLGLAIGGVLTLAGMALLAFTPIAHARWLP